MLNWFLGDEFGAASVYDMCLFQIISVPNSHQNKGEVFYFS